MHLKLTQDNCNSESVSARPYHNTIQRAVLKQSTPRAKSIPTAPRNATPVATTYPHTHVCRRAYKLKCFIRYAWDAKVNLLLGYHVLSKALGDHTARYSSASLYCSERAYTRLITILHIHPYTPHIAPPITACSAFCRNKWVSSRARVPSLPSTPTATRCTTLHGEPLADRLLLDVETNPNAPDLH